MADTKKTRSSIAKEQRIENILLSLKKCDYLTRAQIQAIHKLKGDRNANRFLNDMDEYLNDFRHGMEKVYCLNKAGRERVQCDVVRKKTPNIRHFLLRNQTYIYWKRPTTWENEIKITVGNESIVADAMFTHKGATVFVEIDVSQPMQTNARKMEKYRRMYEMAEEPFYIVWVTDIESRREKLKALMQGIGGQVLTYDEIK